MNYLKKLALAAAATSMLGASAFADGHAKMQGVTDTEILIGSNNDLSGPFAAFGGPATKAAQLVFDEVNAARAVFTAEKSASLWKTMAIKCRKPLQALINCLTATKYSPCCFPWEHR